MFDEDFDLLGVEPASADVQKEKSEGHFSTRGSWFGRISLSMVSRISVLVVDDEPVDIQVIETSLRAAGYSIFTAEGYDEALATFQAHMDEIGLLLTDISLPGKTGIELAMSCLSMKPELRVLFVSGWTGAQWLDYVGIPKEDPYFLPKPFRFSTLVDHVRRVLKSTEPIAWLDKGNKVRVGGFSTY